MRISDWSSDVCSSDLRLQLGYQSSLKHFRYELKRIADENSIPGFTFDLLEHAATSEKGRSRRNAGAGRAKITPRPLVPTHCPLHQFDFANQLSGVADLRSAIARSRVGHSTKRSRQYQEPDRKRSAKARHFLGNGQ